ncbi:MAG: sigma-54-dependent Fis family transcriptional regulator [Desulfofustis sp. PB-SRB1]|jgi:DNA-binding NtrC family response regulator|nr:sigma-54-dependent Fis family transcriptional regulator [Desulfofustis sp. PB-SRB1]MBM1003338.1 sigma-54-dependent Fis family transcriptional regulator [Desulfofustis sp. PB-SRB1]HBH27616.1 sigma-54-dependent Fis family transcriptional regulator [Desulfofustis sp.]HBH30891.1 sigma-54-dependent Fis family transcriptional regulator [Desulfofustis sp.]
MGSVLIVDDNETLRHGLAILVKDQGFSVELAPSAQAARDIVRTALIDVVFLDITLPDGNGLALIGELRELSPGIGIIMLTGDNSARSAVEALKAGAQDYIVKPFETIEFTAVLKQAMSSRLMEKQAALAAKRDTGRSVIGSCQAMQQVNEIVASAATVTSPVLITGETGTGKEVIARAVHERSQLQGGLFVKVDCGTLSESIIESELFGYKRGAFTDAAGDKQGLVELAHGGTLFLDEIGNLPVTVQPTLLRLIEEGTFRKVGGLEDVRVRLRVIAATNNNLEQAVTGGSFREDLYYRLCVLPISLPPLRERGEDVLMLADYFLHRFTNEMNKRIKGFTPAAHDAMLRYTWPGNIRELRNVIERAVIFSKNGWLDHGALKLQPLRSTDPDHIPLKQLEHSHIEKILKQANNNKSKAARILGISRTTLRKKLST